MNTKREYRNFDVTLVLLVLGLCIFGLIIIPSAGEGLGISPDKFRMQKIWVITGFALMIAAAFIDYEFICGFYIPIYAVNIALLAGTIVLKKLSGEAVYREIGIEGVASIMPSEFAKLFTIIWLARLIDKLREKINNIFILTGIVVSSIIPFVLIAMQPSLSASLVIIFITIIMLFIGKLSYKYFVLAVAIIVPLGGFLYYDLNREPHLIIDKVLAGYQIEERIMPYLDPNSANESDLYQLEQSRAAISSGQLSGVGLYNNKVYVPESANDFIFAIIGSEFGFFGCMTVLAVGFLIVAKCLLVSWRSEVFLGKLIAAGVSGMFAFHIFVNVGVATGLLPNTGITFPFISSGGSSIWISMASVGLVLNVGMTKPKSMFED